MTKTVVLVLFLLTIDLYSRPGSTFCEGTPYGATYDSDTASFAACTVSLYILFVVDSISSFAFELFS